MIPIRPRVYAPVKTIELTVRFTVEENPNAYRTAGSDYGSAEHLKDCLVEYVTLPESPLRDDYGRDAWGGYDGAVVTDAQLVSAEIKDAD